MSAREEVERISRFVSWALAFAASDLLVGAVIGVVATMLAPHVDRCALVTFGIFAAVFPDFDLSVYVFRGNRLPGTYDYEHRFFLHKPLYLIGAPILFWMHLGYPEGAAVWLVVWISGSSWHFAHDTFDWVGVEWLYPFLQRSLSLCPFGWNTRADLRTIAKRREGMENTDPGLTAWKSAMILVALLIVVWSLANR